MSPAAGCNVRFVFFLYPLIPAEKSPAFSRALFRSLPRKRTRTRRSRVRVFQGRKREFNIILVAFNLLRWLHDSSVRISRKALLIGLAALFFVAIFAIVFLNAFGIQDELLSLKIVRRLLYDDKSSRFKTWTSYLFSGDWLRYPFGGQKSEFAYHGEWVHNLWLDILNKVGLIPFVIAVIFTITSIRSAYGAAVRMKKTNHNLLSNQIASLGLGALLICMPEPVVDANPYFFFAILMLLGGIKGVECSFGKEDTAESERGF